MNQNVYLIVGWVIMTALSFYVLHLKERKDKRGLLLFVCIFGSPLLGLIVAMCMKKKVDFDSEVETQKNEGTDAINSSITIDQSISNVEEKDSIDDTAQSNTMANERPIAALNMNKYLAWFISLVIAVYNCNDFLGEGPVSAAFDILFSVAELGLWIYITKILYSRHQISYGIRTSILVLMAGGVMASLLCITDLDPAGLLILGIAFMIFQIVIDVILCIKFQGAMRRYAIASILYMIMVFVLSMSMMNSLSGTLPQADRHVFIAFTVMYSIFYQSMLKEAGDSKC